MTLACHSCCSLAMGASPGDRCGGVQGCGQRLELGEGKHGCQEDGRLIRRIWKGAARV